MEKLFHSNQLSVVLGRARDQEPGKSLPKGLPAEQSIPLNEGTCPSIPLSPTAPQAFVAVPCAHPLRCNHSGAVSKTLLSKLGVVLPVQTPSSTHKEDVCFGRGQLLAKPPVHSIAQVPDRLHWLNQGEWGMAF
jgi:hypothetical protein